MAITEILGNRKLQQTESHGHRNFERNMNVIFRNGRLSTFDESMIDFCRQSMIDNEVQTVGG